ncbi:MAG: ribonuclease HII [Chloroflexi bacterium]|nr:ribonuclease HII [Chloroflexota bacterium]
MEEAALAESGFRVVAGVDEAGRGAWAGPLVAAAVILPAARETWAALDGVRDSKVLTPARRAALFDVIVAHARGVGVGWTTADEIDLLGIVAANELAMVRAVERLPMRPDALLIDAFRLRSIDVHQRPIVRGDRCCLSIAAASVIAKVARDEWLTALDDRVSGYGFAIHKGYGVTVHRAALARIGASVLHRHSFAPLRSGMLGQAAGVDGPIHAGDSPISSHARPTDGARAADSSDALDTAAS